MADAAVEFLLGNLRQLLINHAHLIKDAKVQVEKLENDLRLFRVFLTDSTKKRRKDDSLRELFRQIRDVVYEAEDIIDAFVTQAAEAKSRNYLLRAFKSPVSLHSVARRVESIGGKVKEIYGDKNKFDFANLKIGDGGPDEPEAPHLVRKENVVGFEDEAAKIIGYLNEITGHLDIISVIGMPGLGKTTLAGKIFRDEKIQYEFPTRIWVYVSQEFTKKDIYLAILREFTRITEDIQQKKDDELAKTVYAYLEKGKFLIVMDDVWTAEDWDKIKVALPTANFAGKVLITSRHVEVARHANCQRQPHNLRFLTQDESWHLLRYEIFGKPEYPPELEFWGKLIADQCEGIPLAIVVIGGILVKKFSTSDDMSAKIVAWEKVSNSVKAYLKEDPAKRMENIIALSYDKLPYHLRACFLYLGMFPEDFEIPVWKLIRMWIAEGFIQQKDGISLEETAENYLDELINRNLVRVDKRRADDRVKSCRIHDMLRDFCKNEAGRDRENFLQEIKRSPEGFDHPVDEVQKCRRICIHSNVLPFISSRPFGPKVRSFVCFSKEDITLPAENTSAIPAAFKLLRVLDVKPIKFETIPSDMYQLLHLRYIALSFNLAILPPIFAKLWNLETLIVDTSCRTLDIKADIWKMNQLRHLKANALATLPMARKTHKAGEMLQTLGTISPQSCTDEVFDRARNLKKLGIRGKLASLLAGKTVSFNSLVKLGALEKLKLLNDTYPIPSSASLLRGLPPTCKFPPKLKSLTLSKTFLDWTHMSILALLEYLEVLKLKDKAFMGEFWESKDGGFRRLRILHIGRTNLTSWVASHHHYPRLKRLELHKCEQLKEVPLGLADIPTFQELDLYLSKDAAASAVNIFKAKQEKWKQDNINDGDFKLSIFPSLPLT